MIRRVTLADLTPAERRTLVTRSAVPRADVRRAAADIVEAVRTRGDAAVEDYGRRFGGLREGGARVPADEIRKATEAASPEFVHAVRGAAANVRKVHEAQRPDDAVVTVAPGVTIARRWAPLRRVGCYVPGGSAPLPSTLIMTAVPAQVAGVGSIAIATPAGPDGGVDPALLATAGILGVEELLAMGGAQAIAALAYGTESIERVDKIVGPGNAFVTAAKLAVAGDCSIDMPAGPSEALVIADTGADPRHVAADLLAQAEHGPDSPVALVSDDPSVLDAVLDAVRELTDRLDRRDIVEKALSDHGLAVLAADIDEAIAFADEYAPEHLSIHLADAAGAADRITGAGSVFVGAWAPEPVGDYASGANHVLPTGGLACSMSPLGTEDFGSWRQVQTLTREGLAGLRSVVTTLADAEGLGAHRLAVDIRFEP
ncbi:MAG TPA: histidinol dehydrogenase [Acidimicrobiia bacterium]|nr:histidinol dehydrogenase [Acidimicrobiia bacterium]